MQMYLYAKYFFSAASRVGYNSIFPYTYLVKLNGKYNTIIYVT